MSLSTARFLIVVVGVLLPYLVRLPGGRVWVDQYDPYAWEPSLFISGCNALVWGSLLLVSLAYRYPVSLALPVLAGFGFVGYGHAVLDLSGDAQAAVALVTIPVFALVPIAIGGVLGYGLDRWLRRRDRVVAPRDKR